MVLGTSQKLFAILKIDQQSSDVTLPAYACNPRTKTFSNSNLGAFERSFNSFSSYAIFI